MDKITLVSTSDFSRADEWIYFYPDTCAFGNRYDRGYSGKEFMRLLSEFQDKFFNVYVDYEALGGIFRSYDIPWLEEV